MANANKKINIDVPLEHEEQVRAYLVKLSLKKNLINKSVPKEDLWEISQICDHKVENGEWSFLIKFKGYKKREWIADEDCFCEEEIANYLFDNEIRTTYCFCRVSTKNQAGDKHVSLDAQESELRKSIIDPRRRVKVVRITASAYRGIPGEFYTVGECANDGDSIVIYRVDRFGRNIVKYLSWMEELEEKGVNIYSHMDKISYSQDKLEFIQKLLDANKESKMLGDRIRMSIKRRRDRGDEHIGSLPYGKKFQRLGEEDGGKLVVIDDKRALGIINKLKTMQGTCQEIADKLNEDGDYKKNRQWSANMVRRYK